MGRGTMSEDIADQYKQLIRVQASPHRRCWLAGRLTLRLSKSMSAHDHSSGNDNFNAQSSQSNSQTRIPQVSPSL